MSRLYEQASEGRWLALRCSRCAGDNQRMQHDPQRYWWANPLDNVCGPCRCEIEAEEQQAMQAEQAKLLEQEARHEEWLRQNSNEHQGPTGPAINYDHIPF